MRCILTLLVLLAPITFGSGAMANEISVTLDDLAATYARPDADPTGIGVVFVAGSGPTDRNGNSPLGIHANYLKQLSDALVADGASVLRYDKRGIGASKAAMKSEAALRFDEFVDDAKSWADWLRGQNGITCVFMLGHSEGGLVATLVAKQDDLAGLVLLDSPGRPLTAVMREQLSDAPLDKKPVPTPSKS